jgi:hypothetical protein
LKVEAVLTPEEARAPSNGMPRWSGAEQNSKLVRSHLSIALGIFDFPVVIITYLYSVAYDTDEFFDQKLRLANTMGVEIFVQRSKRQE